MEENLFQRLLAAITGGNNTINITGDYVSGDTLDPITPRGNRNLVPEMNDLLGRRRTNVPVTGDVDAANNAINKAI